MFEKQVFGKDIVDCIKNIKNGIEKDLESYKNKLDRDPKFDRNPVEYNEEQIYLIELLTKLCTEETDL